ncbi:MAG: phenylacetic acid degradation bifunctional protein PaaZ [Granulosicoccus sp.]|nr:phenylacetic acid degradation bifunctional protein PaaZ [Granulosicoccus sp.]
MSMQDVHSFIAGRWLPPDNSARDIRHAVNGQLIARAGRQTIEVDQLLDYARSVGGPALRIMSFHDRAALLKALALHLDKNKQTLYELSYASGCTQSDHTLDIDGGIATLFVFASKGRREMPDTSNFLDGPVEQLSRSGEFVGQHIHTPLKGVAIQINAFNFPVWGMLEKLAPALLAGMPVIIKPATATSYIAEHAVRLMLDSKLLPPGSMQLISGMIGNTLDHLTGQDVVSFTGSAATALSIRSNPVLIKNAVRCIAEQDSLNSSVLGPDAQPGTPEFDLFVHEAHKEITTKAGQKCTAIRRLLAPGALVDALIQSLSTRLKNTIVGNPRDSQTQMGALVSSEHKNEVMAKAKTIASEAERVFGDLENFTVSDAGCHPGAFMPPLLYYCSDPDAADLLHKTEAFGPVATVMPYRDSEHAAHLINRAQGSLVSSIFTRDSDFACDIVTSAASYNGRLYFNNRDSQNGASGHGSPLPHMVHGGPGRAGGGEELGGIRAVKHYMQRTAVQGSPDLLSAINKNWIPGAKEITAPSHPFTRKFDDLSIGETIHTASRTISLQDIERFAEFTGDTFYAHMDQLAASRNPFFEGRVAHGYLVLSFAAGLFVEPNEGPVLANTGLDNLRFIKPVMPNDSIQVRLSVKQKTVRSTDYGEVRWHVTISNQLEEPVAEYDLLTMNARAS